MTTPEFIEALVRDREREIKATHLERVADCLRACCNPTAFARLTRRLRHSPEAC